LIEYRTWDMKKLKMMSYIPYKSLKDILILGLVARIILSTFFNRSIFPTIIQSVLFSVFYSGLQ